MEGSLIYNFNENSLLVGCAICMALSLGVWRIPVAKKFLYPIHAVLLGLPLVAAATLHFYARWQILHELGLAFIVAGIVSLIFDIAYHEESFSSPVHSIMERIRLANDELKIVDTSIGTVNQSIKGLNESVEKFDTLQKNVETVLEKHSALFEENSRIVGFVDYRLKVQDAFSLARHRIVSVADYWAIDEKWWKDIKIESDLKDQRNFDRAWEACNLYKALVNAVDGSYRIDNLGNPRFDLQEIIFTGSVPEFSNLPSGSSRSTTDTVVKLIHNNNGKDFQRFLGVAWRWVVGHKIRKYIRDCERYKGLENSIKVEIVVSHCPVSITVVDDRVFTLIVRKENFATESLGTEITTEITTREDQDPPETTRKIAARKYSSCQCKL